MCDCFPKTGGSIRLSDACSGCLGTTEYATHFKQWPQPISSSSFRPEPIGLVNATSPWNQRYSFSKGARFGVPPYCDCTPPEERFRFETTYQHDFFDLNHDSPCKIQSHALPGVGPVKPPVLPKQYLCPFTTETTYARAFDMPQSHFQPLCAQQEPCGGPSQTPCSEECYDPCGLTIRFSPESKTPCVPKLEKKNLIKPGTDTSRCCKCPVPIPCCPCPDISQLCDACCGCEYPCKLHQGTTTPTRKYPIVMNMPRYVPNPRDLPRRPRLLCHGGTLECPLQSQFPTKAAIKQAKQRLMDKIEEERCRFPPECIESTYRSTFKTPPVNDAPTYCSREMKETAAQANRQFMEKGMPPSCLPAYCLDGGRPPDPRPVFDHMSTYGADFIWNVFPRFKILGGEIPCGEFPIKPLCCPPPVSCCPDPCDERTEEKERWGKDWECNPEPPEPCC